MRLRIVSRIYSIVKMQFSKKEPKGVKKMNFKEQKDKIEGFCSNYFEFYAR